MQIQGSLTVNSIVTAGLRVNEGLSAVTLTSDLLLDKYARKSQYYTVTADRNVTLPNALILPLGWSIAIYNNEQSTSTVTLKNYSGSVIKSVEPKNSLSIILTDNTTQAGEWLVTAGGSGGGGVGSGNVILYSASDLITQANNVVTINPFIAHVMNGIDSSGKSVEATVALSNATTVTHPSSYPATKFIYMTFSGTLMEETSRQRGGNQFPSDPSTGDIFFLKPTRKNYKYTSGTGWATYPCVAVGEVTFNSATSISITNYPKNEWWWNYKYGDVRNTVIISSGTVLDIPDITGTPTGTVVSGVKLGNVVATIADGYDNDGNAIDIYVPVHYTTEVSFTLGAPTFYYLLPDGAILASPNKPTGGASLPILDGSVSYANGTMFYSKNDGKNYRLLGNTWEEYPAVCLAYITDLGVGHVYPFNTPAWVPDLTPHSQTFLNASAQTTSVTVDSEIIDPGHLTVNVCNTVLQSTTYSLRSDHKTIDFVYPIEPGLQIEVRWYIPADVAVVRTPDVSTVSVSDFNYFNSLTLYSIVHTTTNVTQNAPLNVTADWIVMYINYNNYKFMRASQLDNPAATLYRTSINGVWTDWSFAYAAWFPGI